MEENAKKLKGSQSERNRRKNRVKTEQKQGKNRGLRDFAASAKSTLCCKTSSQPQAPLCENFRSCETNFDTRVPLRSTGAPISKLRNGCKIPKRKNSHFSQPKPHFAGSLATVKPPFSTRVPFGSPVHSFRSCEMAAKPPHLKILQRTHHEQTCHSRNPILATVGHNLITFWSSNYVYHISFQILGSQESIASNGTRFGFETKKL